MVSSMIGNAVLAPTMMSWILAQIIKISLTYYTVGELSAERLLGAGGMPSSHSALVVSLATAIAFAEGTGSTAFALAVAFAGVVMYDATGVRQAAGKHAKAINQIVRQLRQEHRVDDHSLKELLGHTPIEVIAGAILGFIVALVFESWRV